MVTLSHPHLFFFFFFFVHRERLIESETEMRYIHFLLSATQDGGPSCVLAERAVLVIKGFALFLGCPLQWLYKGYKVCTEDSVGFICTSKVSYPSGHAHLAQQR